MIDSTAAEFDREFFDQGGCCGRFDVLRIRPDLGELIRTGGNPTGQTETIQLYQNTPDPVHFRSHDEVLLLFAGFELVEPGLAGSAFWRPSGPGDISDNAEMNTVSYGGVGASRDRPEVAARAMADDPRDRLSCSAW